MYSLKVQLKPRGKWYKEAKDGTFHILNQCTSMNDNKVYTKNDVTGLTLKTSTKIFLLKKED